MDGKEVWNKSKICRIFRAVPLLRRISHTYCRQNDLVLTVKLKRLFQ